MQTLLMRSLKASAAWSLCFLLMASAAWGQVITSTATGGNWNDPGTWAGNQIPAPGDNVIIATTGANAVNITTNVICNNLTINAGATLNLGTTNLTVNGNTQVNGIFNDAIGGGTNTFTGTLTVNNGGQFRANAPSGTNFFVFRGNITNNAGGLIDIRSNIDYTFNAVGPSLTITSNDTDTRFGGLSGPPIAVGRVQKNVIVDAGSTNLTFDGELIIAAGAELINQNLR